MKSEILELPQDRELRLLEDPIKVGIDVANASNRATILGSLRARPEAARP